MKNDGEGAAAQPRERSLERLVEALEIVEDELGFQVMRLNEHVKPRTEEEAQYHDELREGYKSSQYYVRLLKRYVAGRLERITGEAHVKDELGDGGIDDSGRAAAFVED